MGKFIDLTSKKFGRLTVIERYGYQGKIITWLCTCDCGNSCIVRGDHLRNLTISSCSCLTKELRKINATKHSLARTRLYRIYNCMRNRCYDKKHTHYKNYGGRGITVCNDWLNDRKSFFSWAINNGYKDNLTIDRIDNDKGYSPSNCRWATRYEQQHNKRTKNTI